MLDSQRVTHQRREALEDGAGEEGQSVEGGREGRADRLKETGSVGRPPACDGTGRYAILRGERDAAGKESLKPCW